MPSSNPVGGLNVFYLMHSVAHTICSLIPIITCCYMLPLVAIESVQNYLFCDLEYCKYYFKILSIILVMYLPCGDIMEVKNLPGNISDDLLMYVHIASDFLLQEVVVFSESVCDIQEMMNDGHCEYICMDPKDVKNRIPLLFYSSCCKTVNLACT